MGFTFHLDDAMRASRRVTCLVGKLLDGVVHQGDTVVVQLVDGRAVSVPVMDIMLQGQFVSCIGPRRYGEEPEPLPLGLCIAPEWCDSLPLESIRRGVVLSGGSGSA
jgi:hypothetical protein